MQHSSVSMLPSKVEVTLRKADRVSWGKLEDPNFKAEAPEPAEEEASAAGDDAAADRPDYDIDDDDISDSDEEWAYDTKPRKPQEEKEATEVLKLKEVEEEMKKAAEERRRAEEEKERLEEARRQEAGYEDMPELE